MIEKNRPKITNAWAMYDWANSVYSLVITATLFPIYFNASTSSAFGGDIVEIFGIRVKNSVLYAYAISFSFMIVAILSPLLSGFADVSGKKKYFMQTFVLIGSLGCMGLYFFNGKNIEYGIMCALLGSIGFSGSLVFYNAYLPEIATPDKYDSLSAKGFSLGYIGSVILMVFNLTMVLKPEWYFEGFQKKLLEMQFANPDMSLDEAIDKTRSSFAGIGSRIAFLTVGIWWLGFSLIPFLILPNTKSDKVASKATLQKGFRELKKVWNKLRQLPNTKRFLWAFFFYNMAVQTTMYLAAQFGDTELHLPSGVLIGAILSIQLVAIVGATLFAKLSERKGNYYSLLIMIGIWLLICLGAYFVGTQTQFLALAFVVGLVMGGIQSLSRATYSKLIPDTEDTTSFFSFYDVMEKVGLILGPFIFGFTTQITGSMRNAVIPLFIFFVFGGLIIHQSVKKQGWLR